MPHRLRANRRKRLTLRMRLTLWVVAIFVLIQAVTGLGFWLYQRSADRGMFNDRLVERAMLVAARVEDDFGTLTRESLETLARHELSVLQFERFEVDVINDAGQSLVGEVPRWPVIGPQLVSLIEPEKGFALRNVPDPPADFANSEGNQVLAIAVPLPNNPDTYLIVLTTDAFYARQIALIIRILVVGGLFGLVASMISGWFIAGVAVEPFRRFAGMADKLLPSAVAQSTDPVPTGETANDPDTGADSDDSPEIQQLARELHAARVRIREAFAAQERFLSNISHEIKTPIATLLLEAQTLDRKSLSSTGQEFVEFAEEEMRKLGRLVESFLTLTRVRDGAGERASRTYGANELVMDAMDDCIAMAEQYNVRLDPSLADDEAGLDAMIAGDPDLLRTMVNNLVRNAIRFTPRDGRVQIIAKAEDDATFSIAVRDEGPGLPPELLDKVFNRFVQSSDEVRRQRGHGLGLAIAQGIAELHGGEIMVENLPVTGAEFKAVLPVAVG